jgi:hypothetical protein
MTTQSFHRKAARAFGVFLCLMAVLLSEAAAQDGGMQLHSSADYVYGQTMNFNLAGVNVGDVDTVILFFRLGTSSDTFAVDVPFEPGASIDVMYSLDLTQTHLPPFGSITYWWQVERDTGAMARVPEQVVSYVDDQFTWRQLAATDEQGGGSIRVHWTGESEILGSQAQDVIFEMLPQIGRLVPLDKIIPFDVYIYPSTADLGAALRLAGREFQPGQTFPDLGVLLVTVVNPETADAELRSELSQGLVDLMLFQALDQYAYNAPPWLRRGLAGAVRGARDVVLEETLRSAIRADTTIPVADLCAGMTITDDLAAAQSESLFNFIVTTYGEEAARDLIAAFAGGDDCPAALRRVIHLTPEQLETGWLRATGSDQGARIIAEISVWLILVLAGFGLAGLLLFRPRRR